MLLKTPTFWYDRSTVSCIKNMLLRPISWLYALAHHIHQILGQPQQVDIPVICIGNLTAGGGGKTPTAIATMRYIIEQDIAKKPVFLTRGYGGDEEHILRKYAPVITHKNRFEGACLAQKKGHDLIIMDDGLHNTTLHKDLKIIVVDGKAGFGNTHMIPAGPMRTHLSTGLKLADAVLIIGEDTYGTEQYLPLGATILRAHLRPDIELDREQSYVAFAGLALPDKFFGFLRNDLNAHIADTVPFPDHHPYSAQDITNLHAQAQRHNAQLITTEKDFVKLPETEQANILCLPVSLRITNTNDLALLLKRHITPNNNEGAHE